MGWSGVSQERLERAIRLGLPCHTPAIGEMSLPDPLGMSPAESGEVGVEMLRLAQALTSAAVPFLVEFDEADAHVGLGYPSPTRHLAHQVSISNQEAGRLARVVRFASQHTLTADALAADRVSAAHVDILARLTAGLGSSFDDDELALLGLAEGRTIEQFEQAVAAWRWRVAPELSEEDAEAATDRRYLSMQGDLFGGSTGSFRLEAVGTELLAAALDTRPDPVDSPLPARSLAERQADTLVDMAAHYLGAGPAETDAPGDEAEGTGPESDEEAGTEARTTPMLRLPESVGDPTGRRMGVAGHVDIVIDLASYQHDPLVDVAGIRADFARSGSAPREALEQFFCDASFAALIMDGPKVILEYGRSQPDIPAGLRRAVQRRDRCCQFEGCDRSWAWCDVHHLRPRSRGGPTKLDNLALLCRFHHTMVHQKGWRLEWDPEPTKKRLLTISP